MCVCVCVCVCVHPQPLDCSLSPWVFHSVVLVLLVVQTGSVLLQLALTGNKQFNFSVYEVYEFHDFSMTFP